MNFKEIKKIKNNNLNKNILKNTKNQLDTLENFLDNTLEANELVTSRRDFLKILGFSTAAVTLAACEAPIIKSIPYLVNAEDGVTPPIPGVANYYATTFYTSHDFGSILVKTREGRPIKIEPNKDARFFGDINPRSQAFILSLYDNNKIKEPKIKKLNKFEFVNWKFIDDWMGKGLNEANKYQKQIIILTSSLPSPSTKKIISDFKLKYPTTNHIIYDAISYSHALDASEQIFHKRALPMYDISKARVILSFQADFLNDWNGGHMQKAYASARKPGNNMLKHIQVESNLSLSGSNADIRIPLKPSKVIELLIDVYEVLHGKGSNNTQTYDIINLLKLGGNKSVVFVDGNKNACIIGHLINKKLESEILIKDQFLFVKESNDKIFEDMLMDMYHNKVGVFINYNTNPVYSYYNSQLVKEALSKVDYSISLVEKDNESVEFTKAIAPIPHALECWGDYKFSSKVYSLSQPTIQKIYSTRSFQDSLLKWMGNMLDYYTVLKSFWTKSILHKIGYTFEQALFNGINLSKERDILSYFLNFDINQIILNLKNKIKKKSKWELQLYTKISIGDGFLANNPWLQELPDPISRISWDNYLTINFFDAEKLGLTNKFDGKMALNGSVVNLKLNDTILENVPVFIQPGQAIGSVGLALGYGQTKSVTIGKKIGVNAFSLMLNGNKSHVDLKIKKTKLIHEFACMQVQNTLVGRYDIAREITNFDFINKSTDQWNQSLNLFTYTNSLPLNKINLWQTHENVNGPKFNLSIDMNLCIGCSACVVACQAENNIPVVGKEEIRQFRDMYWLRIDRYYSSKNQITLKDSAYNNLSEKEEYEQLSIPDNNNPEVIFQPVMCQHCNQAPCETVCPVAATSHGSQGQNQMAYNRCVGTRYCANNCPYKVRRFNWFNYANNQKFDYHMNNDLGRMVLNPDVVIRSRGVMEKCSMCIQITQETILQAKQNGTAVKDSEFHTACTQACSSGALEFGDINDSNSKVNQLLQDSRKYTLLEDLGTKPNVFYHYKVRNK